MAMLRNYLARLFRTAVRGIFGAASDWASLIGPPLIFLVFQSFGLKISFAADLLGGWAIAVVSFAVAVVGIVFWRLISAPFHIFAEDQAEIATLKAVPNSFAARQLEALEEQNRVTKLAHDPSQIMIRAQTEQMAKMLYPTNLGI